MKKTLLFSCLLISAASQYSLAKTDITALSPKNSTQVTIYNSADLTLVRQARILNLNKGENTLQFSWANTLIDPTSLDLAPHNPKILVNDLIYPPRLRNLALWHIQSPDADQYPVEISYLTSGLSWQAIYLAHLASDEKTMWLDGDILVTNHSGEDYENTELAIVIGRIHLIDEIAALARREYPYGQPVNQPAQQQMAPTGGRRMKAMMYNMAAAPAPYAPDQEAAPEITKETASEYCLFKVGDKEELRNGWSKRFNFLSKKAIPVTNLYKYDEEQYGQSVNRFISFKNDKAHELGTDPLPEGKFLVYRESDDQHSAYEGTANLKFRPVGADALLNLGQVSNVIVHITMSNIKTENHTFDKEGNISGYDEVKEFRVETKNTRDVPVQIMITRFCEYGKWQLVPHKAPGTYEVLDAQRGRFLLTLPPKGTNTFTYTLTGYLGQRAEVK